jgi:hypothetical protein
LKSTIRSSRTYGSNSLLTKSKEKRRLKRKLQKPFKMLTDKRRDIKVETKVEIKVAENGIDYLLKTSFKDNWNTVSFLKQVLYTIDFN